MLDLAERPRNGDIQPDRGNQWRLASYLTRTGTSRDPVISPRQTSDTVNNSSATPATTTSVTPTATTAPATTPTAVTTPAATPPLTPPSPVELLTAALRNAGVETSGMKLSERWDFVTYPGGGYNNHLITVEAGGRTEQITVDLMMMDPRIAVVDIQRMMAAPANG